MTLDIPDEELLIRRRSEETQTEAQDTPFFDWAGESRFEACCGQSDLEDVPETLGQDDTDIVLESRGGG